jgi:hypothetical protein
MKPLMNSIQNLLRLFNLSQHSPNRNISPAFSHKSFLKFRANAHPACQPYY